MSEDISKRCDAGFSNVPGHLEALRCRDWGCPGISRRAVMQRSWMSRDISEGRGTRVRDVPGIARGAWGLEAEGRWDHFGTRQGPRYGSPRYRPPRDRRADGGVAGALVGEELGLGMPTTLRYDWYRCRSSGGTFGALRGATPSYPLTIVGARGVRTYLRTWSLGPSGSSSWWSSPSSERSWLTWARCS